MMRKELMRWILLLITLSVLVALLYYRITIDEFNLITGLVLLSAIGVLAFFLADVIMNLFKASAIIKNNIRLLIITIFILTVGLELFLRFGLNKYPTYPERMGFEKFSSIFQPGWPTWFYVEGANQEIKLVLPEYTHIRKTNSLGLNEQEIDLEKAKNEYRIISLGDSFTEGQGTSYNSTWVKVMERVLNGHILHKKVTTINAGIGGSDTYFEYILLKEKLLPFDPDLVIVSVNNSDVRDIMLRGGMERFQADGSTVFSRKALSWEWVYGISHIFRHIIHDLFQYDLLFTKKNEIEPEICTAVEKIKSAIDEFERLSKENDFDFLVVTHPLWEDLIHEKRLYNCFDKLISALENEQRINFIDLLEYYKVNDKMSKENVSSFYWPLDGHHNTKGYEVMGSAIADTVMELRLID